MELANKFFFLSGVSSKAKCDFARSGDKVTMTFCHVDDSQNSDRLQVQIRTEKSFDHDTNKTIKNHFISYQLETGLDTIKQADSLPIDNALIVFGWVVEIVNDVFPE